MGALSEIRLCFFKLLYTYQLFFFRVVYKGWKNCLLAFLGAAVGLGCFQYQRQSCVSNLIFFSAKLLNRSLFIEL